MQKKNFVFYLILQLYVFCFGCSNHLQAQVAVYPFKDWVKKLNEHDDTLNKDYSGIAFLFWNMDTARVIPNLIELEKKGAAATSYFPVRFKLLKASLLWRLYYVAAIDTIAQLMYAALQQAYEINDDYLTAYVSWEYGVLMYYAGAIESAAMYCLNGIEIIDKSHIPSSAAQYQLMGEILYHTRDYEKSIYYTRRAMEIETDTSESNKSITINRWNTIALCCQKMSIYDSAFYYYDIAMHVANTSNIEVWKGIISGNKGQIYFFQKEYDIAKPLLEYDYRISKVSNEIASAANSLQWVARINLLQGKKDSALLQVKEAIKMLQQYPEPSYLQNLYYTTAEVYRSIGNNDSFYRYSNLYNHSYDSTERAVANSRLEISRLRLNNQSNIFKIRSLQKELKEDALQRNFIIAAIFLSAAIALLILNQLRVKSKHQHELALQQKMAAEKEVATATEQLNMFTQNIIEKSKLIEQMKQQLDEQALSAEQARMVEELSNQTILTEEDWTKFKMLFEKIYPAFFLKLREKVTDITLAEQRMAALTRLHFTSKQIASILGISLNSVHKAKQRLRQRFQLLPDANIEDFITKM